MKDASPPFDPAVLAQAVAELGDALQALHAHDRAAGVARSATLREKARTGRLKPMRQLGGTGRPAPAPEPTTAPLAFTALEDLAASAIAAPDKEPA